MYAYEVHSQYLRPTAFRSLIITLEPLSLNVNSRGILLKEVYKANYWVQKSNKILKIKCRHVFRRQNFIISDKHQKYTQF
jgi:hypothetical protein